MKCPECHGLGFITVENFGDPESFECPCCYGKGEIPDESSAYGNDCPNGACDV